MGMGHRRRASHGLRRKECHEDLPVADGLPECRTGSVCDPAVGDAPLAIETSKADERQSVRLSRSIKRVDTGESLTSQETAV